MTTIGISTRWLVPILVAATLTKALGVAGLVLVKSYPEQPEEFWASLSCSSLEQYPASVVVKLLDGRSQTIPRSSIGQVIELPDLSKASIVSAEEVQKLGDTVKDLEAAARRYKAASRVLKAETTKLRTALTEIESGNVLVSGKWMSRTEYDSKVARVSSSLSLMGKGGSATEGQIEATLSSQDAIPELRVPSGTIRGDDVFTRVRILAVEPDGLKISHDSGISRVPYERLPAELRAKYKFDPIAAGEHRTKRETQQREAAKWLDEQQKLLAEQKRQQQAVDGRMTENESHDRKSSESAALKKAVSDHEAAAVSGDEWGEALTGTGFTFEKGKCYQLNAVTLTVGEMAVLGTFDVETAAFVLSPPKGQRFPEIEGPILPGVPMNLNAVGRYERRLNTGTQSVPQFTCLYLELNNKEIYRASLSPARAGSLE